MSGVTLYTGFNYTGNSYTISDPGRYKSRNVPGPVDNTVTLIPWSNDSLNSFKVSDDLVVIICDNNTPGSYADFKAKDGGYQNYTRCAWYNDSQPDLRKPTEKNAYDFIKGSKKLSPIQDMSASMSTLIIYKKNNYDNDFCKEMVNVMPDLNCAILPPPTKEFPILAIVLGIIYGIMILSIIVLILRNKLIKCPTC